MNNQGKTRKLFSKVDTFVDKKFGFVARFFKKNFSVIGVVFISLLAIFFAARLFFSRPRLIAAMIEEDIKIITLALERIDAKCSILSIDDDVNEIDFLNVKEFSGSRVGPLNLAYPKKWEGPYMRVNPTLHGNHYDLVKAKDGLFVVPGDGCSLPNGVVIGKDLAINRQTEIFKHMEKDGRLTYGDNKFAAKLIFEVGDWERWHMREDTVQELNRLLKEFGEAMPYAKQNMRREIIRV